MLFSRKKVIKSQKIEVLPAQNPHEIINEAISVCTNNEYNDEKKAELLENFYKQLTNCLASQDKNTLENLREEYASCRQNALDMSNRGYSESEDQKRMFQVYDKVVGKIKVALGNINSQEL